MRNFIWIILLAGVLRGDGLEDQILAQERAGLDALKTGDLKTFGDSTAEDAIFVDSQGPAGKALVMEHTAQFRLHDYTISGVKFLQLSPDSGLIVYKIVESGASHGKEFKAQVWVSSIWAKRPSPVTKQGKWMCLFSQETAARP
jgi:ketosteroid isomerase-like protein